MRHPKARVKNSKAQAPRYIRGEKITTQNSSGKDRAANPFAAPTCSEKTAQAGRIVPDLSELSAESIRTTQPIPAQLLPPTARVQTPRDANGKIRNVNMTYGSYRSFGLCPAKFLGLRQKQDEKVESPRIKRQRRTGRLAEEIAAQPSGPQRAQRTAKLLQEVPRCERAATMATVDRSVIVHDKMLKDSTADRVFEQPQFSYEDVRTGWIFRAKPDLLEYELQSDGSWLIRVVDEKMSSSVTVEHEGQLRFFGLVVKLVIEQQIAQAVKSGVKAQQFKLELVVRLTGEVAEQVARNHVLEIQPGELENRLLPKVRKVCIWIDEAYAAQQFITRPGLHCRRCPFRRDCPASSFVIAKPLDE
jgi:hypothetical protein